MILSQLSSDSVFPNTFAPPALVTIVFVDEFTSHSNPALAADVSERFYCSSRQTLYLNEFAPSVPVTIVLVEEFASRTNPVLSANVSELFYRSSRQTLYFPMNIHLPCL